MIRFIAACFALALLVAPAGAQDEEGLTVIHAGWLLAVPGEAPREAQSIVIRGERIERVEAGYVEIEGAAVIDLRDRFVLPGLIDSHVHLQSELGPDRRWERVTRTESDVALTAARHARTTLMSGFTTVQEVGGRLEASLALRDAIRRGDVIGPRLRVAGQSMSPTGGHADINNFSPVVMDTLGNRYACNGADDCRRAVRELIRAGADLIKITATGGVLSETAAGLEQQFFDDELEAIVGAARMMGRPVVAHAHGRDGVNAALRAGVRAIEHGTYLDDSSIRLFRQTGAYLVPTVLAGVTVTEMAGDAPWMNPAVRAKALEAGPLMLDMLRRAHRGGVNIAFGTDSGVSRHGDNAREFQLMVQAGMTPMQAIRAATVTAAEHLMMADDIGRITPGRYADIIAVAANPLDDVAVLMNVGFVMQGGAVHRNDGS